MQPQPPPGPPMPPPPPMHHPSHIENGGYNHMQSQSKELTVFMNVSHNVTQVCVGGVVVSALILPNLVSGVGPASLSQHVILCTFGYFILMTQGILAFSPVGWASIVRYENKRILHLSMQILGAILAIIGSIIRIVYIATSNDGIFKSFSTAHGICGLLAMILAFVSLIGGLLGLFFPKVMNGKCMKILHSCAGATTLIIAYFALIFAFHDYYRATVGNTNANLSIALSTFALLGTLLTAVMKNVKRIFNE